MALRADLRAWVHARTVVKLTQAAALGCAVFALAWLSIVLTRQTGRTATIWPVNAIVLVCLLRTDARRWPSLLIGGLIGNIAANLAVGDPLSWSIGLSLCNTLEAIICGAGLRGVAGRRLDLARPGHLWLFAGLCGLAAPLISATAAWAVVGSTGDGGAYRVWVTWVLGDSLGLLIVVPPILLLKPTVLANAAASPRRVANGLVLGLLALVVSLVFLESQFPLLFLIPFFLVLVAFQMELAGAALGILITAAISATLVSMGWGPLWLLGPDLTRQMAALQIFLLVCAVTTLPIGATLSERRKVEVALAASEARYRLLADNSTDLIVLLGPDGKTTYVSPSISHFGYAPEEVIGRSLLDFGHPEDMARANRNMADLFAADGLKDAVRREYRMRTKTGAFVWLESNPTVLRDDAGRAVQMVSSLRDVTDRRALEDELVHAKQLAEAAAEAKSEFLANMSHEIRTPLTGVVGFAELLEGIEGLPPEARQCVRRITIASQSLLAVVNDVLDYSKLEAGQVELAPHAFDPAELTRETAEIVAGQIHGKGLEFELRLDPALPPYVLADSARLRQILLNLIGNAVKFTSEGQVTVGVAHAAEPQPRLRFVVSDTGPGIPAESLPTLFHRFTQVDGSNSRQHGGAGLGLAICRQLVGLMGGTIGVESQEGAGSSFWFDVAAPIAERPIDQPGWDAEVFEDRPARILVVDDVAMNRELVRAMLTPLGHQCAEAASGADAVRMAAEGGYDLILMDLQMPGMDGLAATRAIRALGPECETTPILALSANVLDQHIAACQAAGMDDHIAKPIRAAELVTKLHHWLTVGRQHIEPAKQSA